MMTWLDAASALFLVASVALLLLDELRSHAWRRARRVLAVFWVGLAVAFMAKVASVLAPIVRSIGS